jgi:hypothetical protein
MIWRPLRNWGARVHDTALSGAPAVVLENERLRVTVLLSGAHIVECNDKRRDLDLVWLTPDALRLPVAGGAVDGLAAFHDTYPGGWQEILPNGGIPAVYGGAHLAQHDEVAGLPWTAEVVRDEPDEIAVRLTVHTRRTPLRVSKVLRLRAGEPLLRVEEELTNLAPVTTHAMWGQHFAYGRPFLRPDTRIVVPDGLRVLPHPTTVNPPRRAVAPGGPHEWPVVPTPEGGTVDLSRIPSPGAPSDVCYLTGFTEGWYELHRPDGAAVRVEWDAAVLPYLWLWHEFGDTTGYPWWGRAYVVGVEPFSSYPTNGLADAVANGSALVLEPHATKELRWSIGVVA